MGKAASLWRAALVGAAVLALSGCSAAESRDTTIIRVAFNQSESHPEYIAMTEFGKNSVRQRTGNMRFRFILMPLWEIRGRLQNW